MRGVLHRAGSLRAVLMLGLFGAMAGGPGQAAAQNRAATTLEQIQDAFARGDSRELMQSSADRIEIAILGERTTYSKSQAVYVLQAFFQQYPPTRCEFNGRETARTDGSWFAAGHYWHSAGPRPLRLYAGLRLKDGTWELREVRIDAPQE